MRKTFYYCEGCRLFREDEKEGLCKHAEICLTARAQIVKTARKTIEPVDPEGRYQRLIEELRAEEAPDNVFDMLEQWASVLEDLMIIVDERTAALNVFVECAEGPLEAISKMLQKRSPWIPVTERLPENDDDVLVCYRYRTHPQTGVDVDNYSKRAQRWQFDRDVTHWMPLPDPPEECGAPL